MLDPPEPRDHHPHCASRCTLPLFYVAATGEYACDDHHTGHLCSCDDLAEADLERFAAAFADWDQAAFRAWERNHG